MTVNDVIPALAKVVLYVTCSGTFDHGMGIVPGYGVVPWLVRRRGVEKR